MNGKEPEMTEGEKGGSDEIDVPLHRSSPTAQSLGY